MIKVGNIALNGIPRVAIAVSDRESNGSIESRNIDIIEIRIDQFSQLDDAHIKDNIIDRKALNLPLILTVRSPKEGGERYISDTRKLKIFEDNIPLVDAVDIELRSSIVSRVVHLAKKNKKLVVISWHDFKSTPNNKILAGILSAARGKGADVVKIAAKANRAIDVNRLMEWTQKNRSKNIVVIALGSIGAISRLSFPMAGSLITYSYIAAPSGVGQIPLDILQEQLRLFYPRYNQYLINKSAVVEDA